MGMGLKLFFLRDPTKQDSVTGSFGKNKDNCAAGAVLGCFVPFLSPVTLFLLG